MNFVSPVTDLVKILVPTLVGNGWPEMTSGLSGIMWLYRYWYGFTSYGVKPRY